jgi:hypothetical protein
MSYHAVITKETKESNGGASEKRLSQVHTSSSYSDYIDNCGSIWRNLPDSVNGTLIYFLMVFNNHIVQI